MNTGQFRVYKRTQKDYSLAFKLEVVDAIEKGELSQNAAQRKYGIQGNATILVWLRKHGRLDWHSKAPSMSKKATPNKKIKELEKRIKRLEEEKEVLNVAIDIADEMLKTDIRKKYLSLLSSTTSQQQAQLDANDPLAE
jgi:transposase-like protein